jgi:hypothetical protein
MPRGENLWKDRLPKQERLKLLGLDKPLAKGEKSVLLRVRLNEVFAERLKAATPKERGELIMAGVDATGWR